MDGIDADDFISDLLFGFEADDEVASGLRALTKSGKARQLFGDIGRTEMLEEGENVEEASIDEDDADEQSDDDSNRKEAAPNARSQSKKVQSSQATLGMLREQDRKERRKLLASLSDKLPKGVKLLLTEENVPMAKRSLQLTEHMKCATDDPADPILKFSEIFLAPAERPIFLRRKKVIKPRYDYSVSEMVERDEAEIFQKSHVTVPDPQAERVEFLAALREAIEREEQEREKEKAGLEMAVEETEAEKAKREAEEREAVALSEDEEWILLDERDIVLGNIDGDVMAILFDHDFAQSEENKNVETKKQIASAPKFVEMGDNAEEDVQVRRKKRKVKLGSYDEAKIDKLVACLDWEKDILFDTVNSATNLTARLQPNSRAMDIPDSEVVFGGKMKIASDQPAQQHATPHAPAPIGGSGVLGVGGGMGLLSPHVAGYPGSSLATPMGGMYHGHHAYSGMEQSYASLYGAAGMVTPTTPMAGRSMTGMQGMGYSADGSFAGQQMAAYGMNQAGTFAYPGYPNYAGGANPAVPQSPMNYPYPASPFVSRVGTGLPNANPLTPQALPQGANAMMVGRTPSNVGAATTLPGLHPQAGFSNQPPPSPMVRSATQPLLTNPGMQAPSQLHGQSSMQPQQNSGNNSNASNAAPRSSLQTQPTMIIIADDEKSAPTTNSRTSATNAASKPAIGGNSSGAPSSSSFDSDIFLQEDNQDQNVSIQRFGERIRKKLPLPKPQLHGGAVPNTPGGNNNAAQNRTAPIPARNLAGANATPSMAGKANLARAPTQANAASESSERAGLEALTALRRNLVKKRNHYFSYLPYRNLALEEEMDVENGAAKGGYPQTQWERDIIYGDEESSSDEPVLVEGMALDGEKAKEKTKKRQPKLILDLNDSNLMFDRPEERVNFVSEADSDSDSDKSSDEEGVVEMREGPRGKRRRGLQFPRMSDRTHWSRKQLLDEAREIDTFNLSNDAWYIRGEASSTWNRSADIQHSFPGTMYMALKNINPKKEELQNFHRPRRDLSGQSLRLKLPKNSDTRMTIRRHRDLTLRAGKCIVVEYVEEYPPIIADFGMGSKLKHYYRTSFADQVDRMVKNEQGETVIENGFGKVLVMNNEGETVILNNSSDPGERDPSPFFADIPPGVHIQAMENNLFKVPVFHHEAKQSDLLLVRSMSNNQPTNTLYIREIPSLYTAGQILPLKAVYTPQSKLHKKFLRKRLKSFVHWMFLKQQEQIALSKPHSNNNNSNNNNSNSNSNSASSGGGGHSSGNLSFTIGGKSGGGSSHKSPEQQLPTVKMRDVQMAFPNTSDPLIRKKLKPCATFARTQNCWVMKKDFKLETEEEIRKKTTAEEVVLHECMQAGLQRLQDNIGTTEYHHDWISSEISRQFDEHPKGRVMKLIEEELLLTPWNLSTNFVNATGTQTSDTNVVLQLTGFGDPSGKGEGFSFLKVPLKVKSKDGQDATGAGDESKEPVANSDLRKLTSGDAKAVLMGFGVHDIPKQRWERVNLIRKLSTEAKTVGEDDAAVIQYARTKNTLKVYQDQINTKIETIFMNQRQALEKDTDPSEEEDLWEDGDDDLFDLDREIESALMSRAEKDSERNAKKKLVSVTPANKRDDEEDPEKKAFENFADSVLHEGGRPAVQETTRTITIQQDERAGERLPNGLLRLHLTPPEHQKHYLKRTIIDDDGSETVEIITDPIEVKRLIERKRHLGNVNPAAYSFGNGGDEKNQQLKKEKRRIQEKRRRQKKVKKKQKELQELYKRGFREGQTSENVMLQCGRCGMYGHMKTNKACPVYVGDDDNIDQEEKKTLLDHASNSNNLKVTIKRKRGERGGIDRDDDDYY